jgi:hypothetical protein
MPSITIEELNIEDTHNNQQSESENEDPPMEEPQIEESSILPIPTRQSKKQQESVSCPQCNKSMLLKHLNIIIHINVNHQCHNIQ